MDTVALVDELIEEGQQVVDRLVEAGVVVRGACWAKPDDKDRWKLYIVTPLANEKGSSDPYQKVQGVLRSLGTIWLDSPDLSLIGDDHPLAKELSGRLRRYTGKVPPQFPRVRLGVMTVAEDVYIYPLGKTEVRIYGLQFGEPPRGPLHLSFEPHNPHSRLIVGPEESPQVYNAIVGTDWVVAAPDCSSLERGEDGQLELVWNLRGQRIRSDAHEVFTFAKLGLHGFRFIHQPAESQRNG